MTAPAKPLRGSCLCGAVVFEITTPILSMGNCHCSMCRKQHGTAFSTYCQVAAAGLNLLAGADRIRSYASSPGAERRFCGECGTKLCFVAQHSPDSVWVAAGALDDEPGVKPTYHIFVASKAPWYDIGDDLPQHAAYPAEHG